MTEETNMIEGLANGAYTVAIYFGSVNLNQKCEMFSKIFDKNIEMSNTFFKDHDEILFSKDNVQEIKSKYIKMIDDYKPNSANQ